MIGLACKYLSAALLYHINNFSSLPLQCSIAKVAAELNTYSGEYGLWQKRMMHLADGPGNCGKSCRIPVFRSGFA